ncbi:MAG: hypothetical protein IJI58_03175 [Bacilli bacterium]|nr:hypothetical protein [Bacilli bacterium]
MSEYNQYVTAINKIFDYLAKMKAGWKTLDNHNYIESIEEYKQLVSNIATQIKNTGTTQQESGEMGVLGND